ncbi:trigger factor [Clostridium sp. DL1XJH146]
MNTNLEKVENNIVKLEITVEKADFDEAMKKSYKKNVKRFNIPGFRKGKAPMQIIKRHYGEGVFYEDAVNFCIDDTYPNAVKDNNLEPVDSPKIDIVQLEEGKDLIYSAEIVVKPEVTLNEYKGVEVKKVSYVVTDEDIEKELLALQEKNARIFVKEDAPIEKGDTAIIDFKGFIEEEAFEGGEGTDFELVIGSGSFIDNFEDQLIGVKTGEKVEVKVTFPENYGQETLNGKEAKFDVEIKEVKGKELPELNDELADDSSEFETLEELKQDIRSKKEEENKNKEKQEYEEAVIDAVTNNAEVDIPEVMINSEIDYMIKDFEQRLSYQGMDLPTYLQYTNSTEESLRAMMKETAEKKVRSGLVLEAISKAETIEVTEEELKERAKEMAKQYTAGKEEEEVNKMVDLLMNMQKDALESSIVSEKVINFLVEEAKEIA